MSSEPAILQHLEPHLLGNQPSQDITESHAFANGLGIEWDSQLDVFRVAVGETPSIMNLTSRALISEVSKTYNVLNCTVPLKAGFLSFISNGG